LPRSARRLIRRWVPSAKAVAKASIKYQYDWSRTRAFCIGAAGDIWLNVRGREPEGIVEPGAEYEEVREAIRRVFTSLREARTGEALVEGVYFREEVYQGPFLERAPDLLVRFRDVVISEVLMDGKVLRMSRRSAATPKQVKTGSHRPDGILILGGQGSRQGISLSGARLVDVAPTLLYWMGRPVPSYMDGRVLTEAFTPEHLATHPPRSVVREVETGVRDGSDYTREEADLVMERLKDLGYV
jgi:predicted AlkP superfamily phosphohydrolase/phosphomutase